MDLDYRKIATRAEIVAAYDAGSMVAADDVLGNKMGIAAHIAAGTSESDLVLNKKVGITDILSYIGGTVVSLGIALLIGSNWSELGTATRILTTFVPGIAAFIIGLRFSRSTKTEPIGTAFFLISALVAPIALSVLLDSIGLDASLTGWQSLTTGSLFLLSLYWHRSLDNPVFLLFSVIYGTWLFFSLTHFLFADTFSSDSWKFIQYRVLITGAVYMLLGYAFSFNKRVVLSEPLYGFGVFSFLGTAFMLCGWSPHQSAFWELLYPVFVFGALIFSLQIKSGAVITWGTFFLMAYILKISFEYFFSGLGWPLTIIFSGLAMIGTGYMFLSLKKKYLAP